MNDNEIEQLASAIDDGNNGVVYWIPDCTTIKKIVSIGESPTPKEGDVAEPGYVAYTPDGTYIALYNAEFRDFKLVRPVADLFE